MNFEDEDYSKFTNNDINYLNNLNFTFNVHDRFVHVKDSENNYFKCSTPFLKILKPVHTTLNKKKTVAKKYIILETNDDLDFNNQIGEFMFIINKIHEISQEKIREKSISWFNTEFDDIGLDIKVRRPIDQQKESEFIKITIPKNLESEISLMEKGSYVLSTIIFKGLKISSDFIIEEWELSNIITQEKYDEIQNNDFIENSIIEVDTIMENDIEEIIKEKNDLETNNKHDLEKNNKHDLETNNKNDLETEYKESSQNIVEEIIINNAEEPVLLNSSLENKVIIKKNKTKNNKISNTISNTTSNASQIIKENKIKKNNVPIKKHSKKLIFT